MNKMMRKNNKKGSVLTKGLINASLAIVIGTAIFSGATSEKTKLHNIESEINTSIDRASMFLSKGDTYSAKLILSEDILNKYDEIPDSLLPGVEELCDTLNVKR